MPENKSEPQMSGEVPFRRVHGDPYIDLLFELREMLHRLEGQLALSKGRDTKDSNFGHCNSGSAVGVIRSSGEDLLYEESEIDLPDLDHLDHSLFDSPLDPKTVEYARVHAHRLSQTFEQLELIADRENSTVVEIGAACFYRRRLESLFPESRFIYSGKPLHGLSANATSDFVDFDLEKVRWPFNDNSIDFILCFEVLEHIFDDPMHLFSEANRCLRVGGKLVLTTPNICSWRAIRAAITHHSPYLYAPFFPGLPRWESHRIEYSIRDIAEFGRAGGFCTKLMTFNSYAKSQDSKLLKSLFEEYNFNTNLRGDTIFSEFEKVGEVIERFPEWFYKDYHERSVDLGLGKLDASGN